MYGIWGTITPTNKAMELMGRYSSRTDHVGHKVLSLVFILRRKCVSVYYVVNNNEYSIFCKYEAPCCPGLVGIRRIYCCYNFLTNKEVAS